MTAAVGSLMKNVAQQTGVSASNPGVYNGKPKITPCWAARSPSSSALLR